MIGPGGSGGGIRRRRGGSGAEDHDSSASTRQALASSLRLFDVYTKIDDDYMQRSQSGGALTFVTTIVLVVLFYVEINEFCTVDMVQTITVDVRTNQRLPISLNISFPALRCDEVSVDNVDQSGHSQVNLAGSLVKHPLDASGQRTDAFMAKDGECLSCLDAADEEHRCCNVCTDLKQAFVDKDLEYSPELRASRQCSDHVGCQVYGQVVVQKVSGNIHVALGKSKATNGKHVHEFSNQDIHEGFNTSHEIHELFFGERPEGARSALEGARRIVKHGAYMFHYYVKLVPMVIEDEWGGELYTNEYTFSDTARNAQTKSGELSGLPGVFLVYDFSAFLMRKSQKAKPWSYIFTSVCAIIGGVFSLAALVERLITGSLFSGGS